MSHSPASPRARGARVLALLAAPAFVLGCNPELAGSAGCVRVASDEVKVTEGKTCRFSYSGGDAAVYTVFVTKPAYYGEAVGDGRHLKYVAKRGFVGDDEVSIRIVRQGVGHVQWENRTITVTVVPAA